MKIARCRIAEQALQIDLPRRGVEQVRTAHHVRNTLFGVVDHHCQLICELAVGTIHEEIADIALHRLLTDALYAVREAYRIGHRSQAQGPRRLSRRQTISAGSRINASRRETQRGIRDFLPDAAAGICHVSKPFKRVAVKLSALALIDHRIVPLEPEVFERPHDLVSGAGLLARRVQILDAHQPPSARRARIEPAGERSDQRTEVQRPGGRWREPPCIHGCLGYTARFFPKGRPWRRWISPRRISRRPSTTTRW